MSYQFHILSFEGPDIYSLAGGLGTRVTGLGRALGALGYDTHLWYVGDPDQPGHEVSEGVNLHRWCQWLSRHYPGGVYDGNDSKEAEYTHSLPARVVESIVRSVRGGQRAVVLAEEWQTAGAVIQIDWLLRQAGVREQVSLLWNANNTFGFDRIDWARLARAAVITTVSRYMKYLMASIDPATLVVPNGLNEEAYETVSEDSAAAFRKMADNRTVIAKIARWDPDKRWLLAVDIVGEMKRGGWKPLLLARGGREPHGREVLAAAAAGGLQVVDRDLSSPGAAGLLAAIHSAGDADVINITSHMDWETRRLVYQESATVLANSGHEPFGLVGLETMAVGGVACTGCSGEDYAMPGHNALVSHTNDPNEVVTMLDQLRSNPADETAMRSAGRETARQFSWAGVVRRALMPKVELGFRRAG